MQLTPTTSLTITGAKVNLLAGSFDVVAKQFVLQIEWVDSQGNVVPGSGAIVRGTFAQAEAAPQFEGMPGIEQLLWTLLQAQGGPAYAGTVA